MIRIHGERRFSFNFPNGGRIQGVHATSFVSAKRLHQDTFNSMRRPDRTDFGHHQTVHRGDKVLGDVEHQGPHLRTLGTKSLTAIRMTRKPAGRPAW
jgi:hypothetical protein